MEETAQERRRGSLARMFSKLKGAIRRRSGKSQHRVASAPSKSTAEPSAQATSHPQPEAKSPDSTTVELDDALPILSDMDSPLLADTSDVGEAADDDAAQFLLPMLSTRSGLSHERAQNLFDKYGLKLESRKAPANDDKFRRVEKPIRIRIHWQCHDCLSNFGVSKTCAHCGHRRCRECIRSPAKRVKEVLGRTAKEQKEKEARRQATVVAEPSEDAAATAAIAKGLEKSTLTADAPPAAALEPRADEKEEKQAQYQYVIQTRPRAGIEMVLVPKGRKFRRTTCHECQTHLEPASRTECGNCGHKPCRLCPKILPQQPERWSSSPEAPPQMVATVQRVYKKPRQRVRWTCHLCEAMFTDRYRCDSCGHDKCEDCTRSPTKRKQEPPDPAVLQSVNDRLAQMRLLQSPSTVIS